MSWPFQPLLPGGAQQLSGLSPATTGYIKYWSGSAWDIKPVKYWTGSQWTIKPVKYWTGTEWVATTP